MTRRANTALAAIGSLALCACSANQPDVEAELPGFGQACTAAGECSDGLSCRDQACRGDFTVRGEVSLPQADPPAGELHIALFPPADPGIGGGTQPLDPTRALVDEAFGTPATYPVPFELTSTASGVFDAIAYLLLSDPQFEGRVLRGQASILVNENGTLLVEGVEANSLEIELTGESEIVTQSGR